MNLACRPDFGSRAAIACLLEIATILGRGDVRADTLKELEKQADSLRRYASQPGVDQGRLRTLLDNVEKLRDAKRVREVDFDSAGWGSEEFDDGIEID